MNQQNDVWAEITRPGVFINIRKPGTWALRSTADKQLRVFRWDPLDRFQFCAEYGIQTMPLKDAWGGMCFEKCAIPVYVENLKGSLGDRVWEMMVVELGRDEESGGVGVDGARYLWGVGLRWNGDCV